MNRPFHQIAFTWFVYILLGILMLGSLASATTSAIQLFQPIISYVGTAILITVWLSVMIWLRVRPAPWVLRDGKEIHLRRLGPKLHLAAIGALLLLWFPRLADWTRTRARSPVKPETATAPWLRITDLTELKFIASEQARALIVEPDGTVHGTVSDPRLAVFLGIRLLALPFDSQEVKLQRKKNEQWALSEAVVDAVGNWRATIGYRVQPYTNEIPDYEFWEVRAFATRNGQAVIDACSYWCQITSKELNRFGITCSESHVAMRPPRLGAFRGPGYKPKPTHACLEDIE
jgi:hypothetical protein